MENIKTRRTKILYENGIYYFIDIKKMVAVGSIRIDYEDNDIGNAFRSIYNANNGVKSEPEKPESIEHTPKTGHVKNVVTRSQSVKKQTAKA